MGKMQKYLAEALGTFALVGVGSFAIISATAGDDARDRVDRAGLRPRAADRPLRLRRGVGRPLQPRRLDRHVPRSPDHDGRPHRLRGRAVHRRDRGVARRPDRLQRRGRGRHHHAVARRLGRRRRRVRLLGALRRGDPPVVEERARPRERPRRDPPRARRDPRRRDPDQRRLGQPGPQLRACPRRHRVHRSLDLPDRAADRRDRRLDRPPDRRRGRHEPPRRHRRGPAPPGRPSPRRPRRASPAWRGRPTRTPPPHARAAPRRAPPDA